MFHDKKDDSDSNTHIDQVAQDISTDGAQDDQHVGIGSNPTNDFNPVMSSQTQAGATTAPDPPTDDDNSSDNKSVDDNADVNGHQSHDTLRADTQNTHQSSVAPSNLDDIKEKALNQLSPLVDKIDQPPEERFKTLMMLIQASDNHDLIKEAYAAAEKIEDESKKAEALLGIVNEINYFSQKQNN